MTFGKRCGTAVVVIALASVLVAPAADAEQVREPTAQDFQRGREVPLQILAINDFHGNIATSSSLFGGVGRSDFLAANILKAEAGARNSIFVSAGDLIGASPLISALFHDEPTIEAMNIMGLDLNAVGNHEFDEGPAELLRMANGGTLPTDGDLDGTLFKGADFEFLAANVLDESGRTLFAPFSVRDFGGVPVAFIGMTLRGTRFTATPSGVAGLTFNDEVETVNQLIPQLTRRGIQSFVVLLHEGGRSPGGQSDCEGGLSGPIADITRDLDDAVDLVIAGHTNDEFVCEIDGKWVTMADNQGCLFTDIDVTLNTFSFDMSIVAINNVPNLRVGRPVVEVTRLINKYQVLESELSKSVIGRTTSSISRTGNDAGESALGDVIADAQLAATASRANGGADVAFMNPAGIDADILFKRSGGERHGEFTFGEAFDTQPVGNGLVTMTLTGIQIDALLDQQFDNPGRGDNRILQVSAGFAYTWSASAPAGQRVGQSTITIDGVPVVANEHYRVTVNSFIAGGGDNFAVLRSGTDRLSGVVDLDALVTYFNANSPIAPGAQDRITRMS